MTLASAETMPPRRYPAIPLTSEEARALLDACTRHARNPWQRARDRSMVTLMWRAGVRARELVGLELHDWRTFDGSSGIVGVVRVRKPKGWQREKHPARPREVGLGVGPTEEITRWLAQRGTVPGHLFVTRAGSGLCASHLRRLVRQLGVVAGLARRVHPHAFRHTFARELYDEGAGLVEIMQALGHTSLSTTQVYLRSIGATEVVNLTTQREW